MGAIDIILNAMNTVFPTFARSNGSIEAKLIDVVGSYADSEAVERRNTMKVIAKALADQKVTRKEYYRRKSVAYQEGDTISFDPVNLGAFYPVIDTTKQLIKQSYIVGTFPAFINVVNALDEVTGHLRKLTSGELEAFTAYFELFQPLGMDITVQSLDVAKISDDNMRIYVRAGSDLQAILDDVKANLKLHEVALREFNEVTLTEIEDVIQMTDNVVAIGWSNPVAVETLVSGATRTVNPVLGIFELTTGVFTFDTDLQLENLQILQ